MDTPTWRFHTCVYRSCCCCNHLLPTRILVAHFTYKFNSSLYTTVVSLSKSLYNHILKRKSYTKNYLHENHRKYQKSWLFIQISSTNFTQIILQSIISLSCFNCKMSSPEKIIQNSTAILTFRRKVNLLKHCSLM